MSADIESDLRAAFEQASEKLAPRQDLAALVVRAAGRRRRRLAAAALAVVAVAGGGYAAAALGPVSHHLGTEVAGRHDRRGARTLLTISLPAGAGAVALASAGPYLYVAASKMGDPPYTLSAYDRETGRLVRRVQVPAEPSALRAGPGGWLWLAFYPDQDGGPSGIWLLNADLSRRSGYSRLAVPDVLPASPRTALLPTQAGLTKLIMPPPGAPGRATVTADHAGQVDGRFAISHLAAAGRTVAALVTNGAGLAPRLVIAGHPRITYGGGSSAAIGSVAGQDGGFWAVISAQSVPYTGPLIRLSTGLRVLTSAVGSDLALRHAATVWTAGHTVWVSSSQRHHPLVCFAYRGTAGPVRTVRVPGRPLLLAAAGPVVYVSLGASQSSRRSAIRAYPVPAACR
jgi:hypothetical protein